MNKNKIILVKTEHFENCLNKVKEPTADIKRILNGFENAVKAYDFDLNKSKFLI